MSLDKCVCHYQKERERDYPNPAKSCLGPPRGARQTLILSVLTGGCSRISHACTHRSVCSLSSLPRCARPHRRLSAPGSSTAPGIPSWRSHSVTAQSPVGRHLGLFQLGRSHVKPLSTCVKKSVWTRFRLPWIIA